MISELYLKIPRRIRILAIFLFIILLAFLLTRVLLVDSKSVPSDFLKARQQASLIAQEIVSLSNETTNNLNNISNLDKERKYKEALSIISQEIEHNRLAREKAVALSIQLETMTKNISGITPPDAGQKALEAVSSEVALISRLVNYNDYLVQLLEILQSKFSGQGGDSGGKVQELIQKINDEARAINDLNRKFNEAMDGFDSGA